VKIRNLKMDMKIEHPPMDYGYDGKKKPSSPNVVIGDP